MLPMRNIVNRVGVLCVLSMVFLLLPCFSDFSSASSVRVDSVYFCASFDYEQRRLNHPPQAGKRALDLNVGEPRTVRMIYFLPNDRPVRQEVADEMKAMIRQVQIFYAEQMQAHGYGNLTLRVETDAQGKPLVHRVDGQHSDGHYLYDALIVYDEIGQVFDLQENNYIVLVDLSIGIIRIRGTWLGGHGIGRGKAGGTAMVGSRVDFRLVAHELGHTFGLSHDFRDDAYIMSYGAKRNSLSACAAEFLAAHPYFNPDSPIKRIQPPTVEVISPLTYLAGSESVSIQLKVEDSEALYQVFLRTDGEVKTCRGLEGERNAIIEFEYDGSIPSSPGSRLSDRIAHPINVKVVDTEGNANGTNVVLAERSSHLITILEGHTDEVNAVAFSPDSNILASGDRDGSVILWDVGNREFIGTLGGDGGEVKSVAFSPDGATLASGAWSAVKLWDVGNRELIGTLKGDRYGVNSVAFSPESATLASGFWDGKVILWDVATGEVITTFEGHKDVVTSVAFSLPDGATLASGSKDGTIKLWDVGNRVLLDTLEGHAYGVNEVAFSPDGATLASGSWRTIKLWDMRNRGVNATLEGHMHHVTSVAFSPDGATLASGSRDGTIKLWDVSSGGEIVTFANTSQNNPVAFSSGGTTLASGSGGGTIALWDVSPYTASQFRNPDFDGDGAVDFTDFVAFAAKFGLGRGDAGYDARYDLDEDGNIGFGDFLIFAGAFGEEAPSTN